jgi:predicted dithiol-disulfide oxidoreductase (DUF899 family)
MTPNPVVSRTEWLLARKAHLEKEKELTRLRDQLHRQRRELPWVRIDTPYVFAGPDGPVALANLFAGRSQLIVQHFMFGPGWKEGCVGCSFTADHNDAARMHLEAHDVSLAAVSRAPIGEIEPFKRRMGWRFAWVSSAGNTFNRDFDVSFTDEEIATGTAYYNYRAGGAQGGTEGSGHSVFVRDAAGTVYHTYSTFARGGEQFAGAYNFLDITPRGRNENGPGFNLTDWVRHHDTYGQAGVVDATGRYRAAESGCGCEAAEARA